MLEGAREGVSPTEAHYDEMRVSLRMDSPEFEEFLEEFAPIAMLSHEPELFTIPYDHAIGEMSGTELLEIEWMFEEAKEGK